MTPTYETILDSRTIDVDGDSVEIRYVVAYFPRAANGRKSARPYEYSVRFFDPDEKEIKYARCDFRKAKDDATLVRYFAERAEDEVRGIIEKNRDDEAFVDWRDDEDYRADDEYDW